MSSIISKSNNYGVKFQEALSKDLKNNILYVAHGAEDKLVPCYMVNELYEACGSENKDILIVEGADHAQSYMLGKERFEAKLDNMLEMIKM